MKHKDEIKIQLAERIKEFRRELRDSEKKTTSLDKDEKMKQMNQSMEKFRRTIQSFGLDINHKVSIDLFYIEQQF